MNADPQPWCPLPVSHNTLIAGEKTVVGRARGHQGDQAGAGGRLQHHPAGDSHDEGLPPSQHCRLFWILPQVGKYCYKNTCAKMYVNLCTVGDVYLNNISVEIV